MFSKNPIQNTYFDESKKIDPYTFNEFERKRKGKFKKRLIISLLVIVLIIGTWYGARANQAIEKISTTNGTLLERILRLLPIDNSFLLRLPVEKSIFEEPNTIEKRINFLVLGMRGVDDPNGGLLTDSIMIVSVRPFDGRIALISIPRDLYVPLPGKKERHKINEAYEIGDYQTHGKGLEYVKSVIGNVAGIPIHYAAIINFQGYKDLIDSLGGVEINLEKPFVEAVPFEEGSINLPAGKQILDGQTALLYVRARMSSSDFDRSRRQGEIIKAIQEKIFKTGIIFNPYRLNKILSAIENNIKTDMRVWETEETIKVLAGLKNPQLKTRVLDNGPDKILYSTFTDEGAFVLLPSGDSYEKIREIAKNIFN